MSDMVRSTYAILLGYAKMTGKPFSEVAVKYANLLHPMPTDVKGKIRYCESFARLMGDLATFYSGPPVFESKGNQRKLLILRYFSGRASATSFDVSSDLNSSLTQMQVNVSGDIINRVCLLGDHLGEGDADGRLWFTNSLRLGEED